MQPPPPHAFLKHFHASGLSGNGNGGISTGYKQLRGAAATPSYTDQQSSVLENNSGQADDSQLQYHQSSPTSLATISGGTLVVGGNSGSSSSGNSPQNNSNNSTNPFRINSSATSNGHIANTGGNNSTSHFRSTSTLNPQLNSSSTLHHHHNQQPHYNLSSAGHHNTSSTGGGGGGGGGGHYAANLAAGLQQQQQQQQQQQSAKKTTTSTSTSLLLDPTRITSNTGSGAQLAQLAPAAAAQFSSTSPLSLLGEAATGSSSSSSSSMLVPPLNNHHHHNHQLRVNTCATCSSVHWGGGLRENLASLALMCILSLLTAFLALFFLQRSCPLTLGFAEAFAGDPPANHTRLTSVGKTAHSLVVSPGASSSSSSSSSVTPNFNQRLSTSNTGANRNEYLRVFQISVCLSTLTIALNLCCLFVCAIQFLSIVKLLKVTTPFGVRRAADFIKRTSHIRVLAFGAFLLSIPIFFTGVILYTFVNFDEVPALVTSLIIGLGIIFCGVASVQNVYLWHHNSSNINYTFSPPPSSSV
ncbi:hypothetical protein TYRP_002901 [Tyrophagus putrescentiae]|nr:hypothetical protein TYRP_002901 [Tyrophagus putrescentiae]